ncbi:MAG: hypothetical protein QXY49_04170 [Thermofilaceae archaeon]
MEELKDMSVYLVMVFKRFTGVRYERLREAISYVEWLKGDP